MTKRRTYSSRPGTNYYTSTDSANPNPVCRRGGCGEKAQDGSEWCADHEADVTAAQAFAAEQIASLAGRGRIIVKPVQQ
jgi:hypothetical protein